MIHFKHYQYLVSGWIKRNWFKVLVIAFMIFVIIQVSKLNKTERYCRWADSSCSDAQATCEDTHSICDDTQSYCDDAQSYCSECENCGY